MGGTQAATLMLMTFRRFLAAWDYCERLQTRLANCSHHWEQDTRDCLAPQRHELFHPPIDGYRRNRQRRRQLLRFGIVACHTSDGGTTNQERRFGRDNSADGVGNHCAVVKKFGGFDRFTAFLQRKKCGMSNSRTGLHMSVFRSSTIAALRAVLMLCFGAFGIASARAEDCTQWRYQTPAMEVFGIRLGQSLADVRYKSRYAPKLPGPRFIDGIPVEVYINDKPPPGLSWETIACANGEEIIVGIDGGEFMFGTPPPIEDWLLDQQMDLRRAGVREVRRDVQGREQHLWGVKESVDGPTPEHAADYLILRRLCRPEERPGRSVCELSSWVAYKARSKALIH